MLCVVEITVMVKQFTMGLCGLLKKSKLLNCVCTA